MSANKARLVTRVDFKPRAVLFDLDGTLLDTAPDMASALNRVRAEDGLDPLPFEAIRPLASHGSLAMTRLGFDFPDTSAEFERRRQRLLDVYSEHVADATRLFPGMAEVLDQIERSERPWGIVTNKPGWLTAPLLDRLALSDRAACVISGDSTERSKPHPDPLLIAARQLRTDPSSCLYIGDAERDVEAAVAARMPVLIATYGYIAPDEDPLAWGGIGHVAAPQEILAWL